MAKHQDSFYFDTFLACAEDACKAAHLLESTMREYHPESIREKLDEMHAIEHGADEKKHALLNALVKAFITPIERDDIYDLSRNIDDMTDKIEDVLQRLYCNNIQTIRPDALKMTATLIRCTEEVKTLLGKLPDFKRDRTLHEHIITINTMEEEGDRLFLACMRELHETCSDPIEVIAWREVYHYLESCLDACEHVADSVESVIMNNRCVLLIQPAFPPRPPCGRGAFFCRGAQTFFASLLTGGNPSVILGIQIPPRGVGIC